MSLDTENATRFHRAVQYLFEKTPIFEIPHEQQRIWLARQLLANNDPNLRETAKKRFDQYIVTQTFKDAKTALSMGHRWDYFYKGSAFLLFMILKPIFSPQSPQKLLVTVPKSIFPASYQHYSAIKLDVTRIIAVTPLIVKFFSNWIEPKKETVESLDKWTRTANFLEMVTWNLSLIMFISKMRKDFILKGIVINLSLLMISIGLLIRPLQLMFHNTPKKDLDFLKLLDDQIALYSLPFYEHNPLNQFTNMYKEGSLSTRDLVLFRKAIADRFFDIVSKILLPTRFTSFPMEHGKKQLRQFKENFTINSYRDIEHVHPEQLDHIRLQFKLYEKLFDCCENIYEKNGKPTQHQLLTVFRNNHSALSKTFDAAFLQEIEENLKCEITINDLKKLVPGFTP